MKTTIVGGGNIGTQFAVHCAEKGHEVTIYTSKPELFDMHLNIVDETGAVTHAGNIKSSTFDPKEAFCNAELIIVTLPATMMSTIAETIYRYSSSNAVIGVVPGSGGSECAFRKCIERGNTFFGIERVPAIARLIQKGKTVKSTGYRDELHISAFPHQKADECAKLIGSIFDKKTTVIPNYLNLTLMPSNPILHTTRLRTLFNDWHEGVVYKRVPLFYEEWNDASSELLIACDDELQKICRALPEFDLQYVRSLRLHYESMTAQAMTNKISSIPAFKGLSSPTVKVDGGLIPDLHSRYFTADFSYGLSIIKQVAVFACVDTPNIDETLDWYKRIALNKDKFCFSDYGINNIEDLRQFYCQSVPKH